MALSSLGIKSQNRNKWQKKLRTEPSQRHSFFILHILAHIIFGCWNFRKKQRIYFSLIRSQSTVALFTRAPQDNSRFRQVLSKYRVFTLVLTCWGHMCEFTYRKTLWCNIFSALCPVIQVFKHVSVVEQTPLAHPSAPGQWVLHRLCF